MFCLVVEVWMCDSCEKTEFGCCVDLENAALGPDFDGCPPKGGNGTGGYKDCTLTVSETLCQAGSDLDDDLE